VSVGKKQVALMSATDKVDVNELSKKLGQSQLSELLKRTRQIERETKAGVR